LKQQQAQRARAGSSGRAPDEANACEARRKLEDEAREVAGMFLQQLGGLNPPPLPPPRRGRHAAPPAAAAAAWGTGLHYQARDVVVKAVERVQNWRLWTAYYLKRE
jgi:hypothetical protein